MTRADTRAARLARKRVLARVLSCWSCRRRPGRLVVLSGPGVPAVWSCRACAGVQVAPRRGRADR